MIANELKSISKLGDSIEGITPENVKTALFIRWTRDPPHNPLEDLMVVDDFLSSMFYPRTAYGRRMALTELLISIITEQLLHHREVMEIPGQPSDKTLCEASDAIRQAAKTRNTELIGWTWVYYRYVRVDLEMTQQAFLPVVGLDDRTVRRYQDVTFSRIAQILLEKESVARRSHVSSAETALRTEFNQSEITITLKAEDVLQIIKSDQAIFNAVAKWIMYERIKEIENKIAWVWEEQSEIYRKAAAERSLAYVRHGS